MQLSQLMDDDDDDDDNDYEDANALFTSLNNFKQDLCIGDIARNIRKGFNMTRNGEKISRRSYEVQVLNLS